MKQINFKETSSQKIYADYIKRIKRMTSVLSKKDQEDVLMEFNSHIYEGMARGENRPEVEHLLGVLEKLGAPEEVLKDLVAQKKLEQATKSFNPIDVFKALVLNIGNGILYVIFAILYLSLFAFVFLIYAKITTPAEVGLFFENGNFRALGKINPAYIEGSQIVEVLGGWFIPVMLLSTVVLYFLITLLLRLKRKTRK